MKGKIHSPLLPLLSSAFLEIRSSDEQKRKGLASSSSSFFFDSLYYTRGTRAREIDDVQSTFRLWRGSQTIDQKEVPWFENRSDALRNDVTIQSQLFTWAALLYGARHLFPVLPLNRKVMNYILGHHPSLRSFFSILGAVRPSKWTNLLRANNTVYYSSPSNNQYHMQHETDTKQIHKSLCYSNRWQFFHQHLKYERDLWGVLR